VINGDPSGGGIVIDTGGNMIVNQGLLEGELTIDSAIANSGTIAANSGQVIAGGAIENSGKLWADGSNLTASGAVAGSGTDEITGKATFEFGAVVGSGQAVDFDAGSTGTLRLDKSQSFAGTVAGLAQNGSNFLDLSDIIFGTATKATYSGTSSSGSLQVTDGTHTADIGLLGNYTASTFVTASDGHGGTLVHDPAVALLVQAAASFAPSPGLGATHGLLTPPPESAPPLLAAHAV